MSVQSCQVQSKIVTSVEFNYINVFSLISFHSIDTRLQSVNLFFHIKSNSDQHLQYYCHAPVNFIIIIVNLIHYCLKIFNWKVF